MKRTCLLLPAVAALFAQALSAEPTSAKPSSVGNIMYVGDSITHGVNSASYRWQLHKVFADNNLSYTELGINTGNTPGHLGGSALKNTTADYAGSTFRNTHCAQSSGRAWEVSGNASGGKPANQKYQRYNGTNIKNWLGLDKKTNRGEPYNGPVFTKDDTPARVCIMIGTNDLLSDTKQGSTLVANKDKEMTDLIKDVDAIVATIRKVAPKAQISINEIPAWCMAGTMANADVHEAVQEYNSRLRKWAQKKKITVINVNRGLADVTSTKPLDGIPSMFTADKLHPAAQGDLIIAGNMARALGWGGRTAGLPRKAASALAPLPSFSADGASADGQNAYKLKDGDSVSASFSPAAEFTVEFTPTLGNGSKDGWDADSALSATIPGAGSLSISEGFIRWNGTTLFSADMSANKEPIRICSVPGNDDATIPGGIYVWLGDMLIGEALPTSAPTGDTLSFSLTGSATAHLILHAADPGHAFAPTTTPPPSSPKSKSKKRG